MIENILIFSFIIIIILVVFLYSGNSGNSSNFIGCYKDTNDRDLPDYLGRYTLEEALKLGKEKNYKYIGMQYPQGTNSGVLDGTAEVWAGNNHGKHGKVDCSDSMKYKGVEMGSAWINAVYKIM